MNFMCFCEVAKLSAWQMLSRDEKPQGGVISLACWWLQESIAWKISVSGLKDDFDCLGNKFYDI